ncbi:response regulator [candidate division KSB3 bacterium]|uniref:histidine kinase n=1 Tax=candidate division KSB3 bacterium TaxID=2044937 RepID=A0A9D5JWN1_9BACT|nr:response regulator [candidate division KSB3 bacterium]MBD3325583.1 response regulator [candidate division KSB3 bacterium]
MMHKTTILIVDDNPTNLNVLLDYLHDQTYKVLIAPSGEHALQQTQRVIPDLILLDVMMPGIDGFETCRRLKAQDATKEIPVIFMTALTETVDKVNGFEAGGVDYITKPFQAEEVLVRVQTHLSLRNLQRHLKEQNALLQEEIQKRKQGEEALRKLNQELADINASKDRFFSIIAHDLRSPFNWLIGLPSDMIEHIDDYSKPEIQDILCQMQASTERIYTLLTNLLEWARLQQGVIQYTPEPLFLDKMAAHVVQIFADDTQEKQITIHNLVQPGTAAYADMNMVNTILRNLLSNALKFTNPQGQISISAHTRAHTVEVQVTDTGIGISPDNLAKLFRIDVKYVGVGTAGERGSGLGLILCKELVEQNGGHISVESEVGKGTTFTFTLPTEASP